jgi:hypothetical protein
VFNTFVIDAYRKDIFDSGNANRQYATVSEDQVEMKGMQC